MTPMTGQKRKRYRSIIYAESSRPAAIVNVSLATGEARTITSSKCIWNVAL